MMMEDTKKWVQEKEIVGLMVYINVHTLFEK